MLSGDRNSWFVRSVRWLDSTAATNTAIQRDRRETTYAVYYRTRCHGNWNERVPRGDSPFIAGGISLGRADAPARESHEGGRVLGLSTLRRSQYRTNLLVFLAGQEQLHKKRGCFRLSWQQQRLHSGPAILVAVRALQSSVRIHCIQRGK